MKKSWIVIVAMFSLFSCDKAIDDFQLHNFIKFYGNGYESVGYDVIRLADNTYVLTGYDAVDGTTDSDLQILCAKANEYGNEEWSFIYGDPNVREEGMIVRQVDDGFLFAGIAKGDMTHSFLLKTGLNGDSLWYKEIGDDTTHVEIADLAVGIDGLYLCGSAYRTGESEDYYALKLDFDGSDIWEINDLQARDSRFRNAFLTPYEVVFIGYDGVNENVAVSTFGREFASNPKENPRISVNIASVQEVKQLSGFYYIMVNGTDLTRLIKIDSDFNLVWESVDIPSVSGKTFESYTGGSFLLFAESGPENTKMISTFRIDENGSLSSTESDYRAINGTAWSTRRTGDGGIILIGATNATYGTTVQLLKTGEGLYLLKP